MTPLYQKVKEYISQGIRSGHWKTGQRIPSEHELVKMMKASRMTVNRALNELSSEGLLVRKAGIGTFVTGITGHAHPLAIQNIADEIRARGHEHKARVVSLETVFAVGELATNFNVLSRMQLFHSLIVHYENGQPIQVEDRYVNPVLAPEYLEIDFTQTTAYEYLIRVAALQEAEHILRAVMPPPRVRTLLRMESTEPCLLLLRRTWAKQLVVTSAKLYYPGTRYELTGRFKPYASAPDH